MISPAGNLADETRKSTGGQHKSDAFRVPSAIRKVDCHKGAEAGQKSREKKVQPIERLQACEAAPRCLVRCAMSTASDGPAHYAGTGCDRLCTETAALDGFRIALQHLELRLVAVAPEPDVEAVSRRPAGRALSGPAATPAARGST